MELKDTCTILLEKNTQKVKCFKFMSKELGRELALHEDTDNKSHSTITDVKTGLRLGTLLMPTKQVKETDIQEKVLWFISHYTMPIIVERFEETDKTTMQEKLEKRKKK